VMIVVLEVRDQILNVHIVGLERTTVTEMEVPDDLERS
jgi:hypothetical protein